MENARVVLSIEDAARLLSMGKRHVHELVAWREIKTLALEDVQAYDARRKARHAKAIEDHRRRVTEICSS